MARIADSVEIKQPVDKVFAYTAEATNWPKWQSIITKSEQTSQDSMCVDATYKGICRMMGLSMMWTAKVNEYDLNKKWAKTIKCGGMIIKERVTYDPVDERTKFTIVYDMKIGGLLKLFSPMIVSTMRKETKKSLGDLKSILEAQT